MRLLSLAAALLAAPLALASVGCAADETGESTDYLKDVEKTGSKSQKWIYEGPLPALSSPSMVVSLKGHTARITGLLPTTFTGELPYWAVTTPEGLRTRLTVVYPIATGAIDPSTGSAPMAPGRYRTLFGVPFVPTNEKASWGGFPYLLYQAQRGIAMHGPITSMRNLEAGDWDWRLLRGKVSHGCNRMQGEHVVELAHLLGMQMNKPHTVSDRSTISMTIDVITEWDTFEGSYVDVDYPAQPDVQLPTGDVRVFPTWDSRELPNLVCAYDAARPLDGTHCADEGEIERDMITGELLYTPSDEPWIGTPCTSNDECDFEADGAQAFCLQNDGYGFCATPCAGYCPDRAGEAGTFCATIQVPNTSALTGACVAKAAPENDGCDDIDGTSLRRATRYVGSSGAAAKVATVCSF